MALPERLRVLPAPSAPSAEEQARASEEPVLRRRALKAAAQSEPLILAGLEQESEPQQQERARVPEEPVPEVSRAAWT